MSRQRSAWAVLGRLVRATVHVVRGLWIIRTRFDRLTDAQRTLAVRDWSREVVALCCCGLGETCCRCKSICRVSHCLIYRDKGFVYPIPKGRQVGY